MPSGSGQRSDMAQQGGSLGNQMDLILNPRFVTLGRLCNPLSGSVFSCQMKLVRATFTANGLLIFRAESFCTVLVMLYFLKSLLFTGSEQEVGQLRWNSNSFSLNLANGL